MHPRREGRRKTDWSGNFSLVKRGWANPAPESKREEGGSTCSRPLVTCLEEKDYVGKVSAAVEGKRARSGLGQGLILRGIRHFGGARLDRRGRTDTSERKPHLFPF